MGSQTNEIPKRLIQTAKSKDLPPLGKAAVSSLRLHNPDLEYCFFDDKQVDDFIHSRPQYRELFASYSVPIQRYDFFRYLAIYELGGFYFDTDVLPTSRLSELRGYTCVFSFERLTYCELLRNRYGMDWEIGNYAFGATPRHPFVGAIIENCFRAQRDHAWRDEALKSLPRFLRNDLYVIHTTGPGLVSRTLAEYRNAEFPVHVLFPKNVLDRKNCWNLFGPFGIHLGQGSWREDNGWRSRVVNFFRRRNIDRALRLGRAHGPGRAVNSGQS